MAGRLVVLDRAGRAKTKSFVLGSGMCTLGRSTACDIRVLLPEVSPHHATVTVHANQTVVRNVGSGTTQVNGAPVSVCALQHGDELDICGRKLRWEYDTPQAPKRNRTQSALAPAPPPPPRAPRRGTLAAPPRPPDRDVQLALELRHRASMPASSGAGGKQVAIVQPQRRNTDNQNEGTSPRLVVSPHRPHRPPAEQAAPAPAPAPRKSAGQSLHTPTKATLWIESRRGRARATSLRTATPLRLAVLRKALTPAPRPTKVRVTKIQAPLRIDHTKQAAIMLMTGHTPKPKPPGARTPGARTPGARTPGARTPGARTPGARTPGFVAKRRSPAARAPARGSTPRPSARKSRKRGEGRHSVSVLDITDSETSARSAALPNPPKSALKSGRSRKTESIKFDLSNLENHSEDDDILMVSSTTRDATENVTLRYSSSPPSPSPRRSIHSRSERMLQSLGSPLRSPTRTRTSASASPASPRSMKSARGSIIIQKALESSDTFVTEYSNKSGSPCRDLEAYSVVDLVSLESSSSRSAYGSAGSPRRAGFGASTPRPGRAPPGGPRATPGGPRATPGGPRATPDGSRAAPDGSLATPMDATLTTPDNAPRAPTRSTRKSQGARGRSRLDDSTRTIDSLEDDSPKSSRKLVKSASKRSRSLTDSYPESQTYVSLDSSHGDISTTAKRGSRSRLDPSDLLESPDNISIESMKRSLSRVLSASKRSPRPRDHTFEESPKGISPRNSKARSPPKRSSRGDATVTLGSPTDNISIGSLQESLGKKLSASRSRSRLDDSSLLESPKVSANSTRKSLGKTLSASKRGSRSQIDNITLESPENVSARSSRKSSGKSLVGSPENVSVKSTGKSARKSPSPTKRSSRSQLDSSAPLESPKTNISNASRKSASKTPSPSKRTSRCQLNNTASLKSPVLVNSSRKSHGQALSASKRSSRSQVVSILSSPTDLTDSTRNSTGKSFASTRGSRSKLIDSVLSPQLDTLSDSTRKSLGKILSVSKRGSRSQLVETILSSPETESLADSTRKSVAKTPAKRGSRSHVEGILSSPEATNNSTRKYAEKSLFTSEDVESVLCSPDATNNSSRKSTGKSLSASKRGSRSKIIDSLLSPQLDTLAHSTRKSLGQTLSASKRSSRSQVIVSVSPKLDASANSTRQSTVLTDSKRASRLADSPFNSPKALADSTRKSLGKTPKRGSQSQLDSRATLESPKDSRTSPKDANNSARNSAGKTLSTSTRNSRSKIIDSVLSTQLDVLSDSTRKSLGKSLSTTKRGSRCQLVDIASPRDVSTRNSAGKSPFPSKRSRSQLNYSVPTESPRNTSRKSRAETPTTSRRTRSLPIESPKDAKKPRGSAIATSKRSIREVAASPVVSPRGNVSPPSSKSAKSPSIIPLASPKVASPSKSPKSPAKSPVISPKVSKARTSRKTLSVSITSARNETVMDGEVTPEERGSPEDAGTPILSIRSLLDATVSDSPGEPPRKRGRISALEKRKTFGAHNAPRSARGSIRSKSFILVRDTGDVTPTGVAEPTPEAVKSKHSSAKKSRSRRSIIDNLDDSGLVKHLFNSPVKRKLSQSMSEFSRRLEEHEETSPDVSGVKRLFTKKSPRNELGDFNGVRRLMRTPRARRSIKNDLTDVAGVKVMFAAAPRDSFGDVRGVKRAFQASPKDDLRQVSGVKSLFNEKKPRDDLSDVRGVRELFKRGPRNELDASGVKDALQVKSPKNDLRDVRGVKRLFGQSRAGTSPNVSGVASLPDEPTPAEAMFDRLAGRPPGRATYSRTFAARSAQKPARRRRTASLSLDAIVGDVEGWLERELRRRAGGAASRELRQLATATVAGGAPLLASRSRHSGAPRRSAAESYAEHTLPLKKRALVHSTPLRGRASRAADATPARVSPIAAQSIREPAPGSPSVVLDSPKEPKISEAPEPEKVEKDESVKPSPKKTRSKRAEEAASGQRAPRRGKKAASPKKKPPKRAVADKKALETVEEPEEVPATKPGARPATSKKSPTPKKATRAKKVSTPTEVTPKKATRAKKVSTPIKLTPKKSTRGKKIPTPPASPEKAPTPKKATRAKKVVTPTNVSPEKSPVPKKATRAKKVVTPNAASPKNLPTSKVTRSKKVVNATPKKTTAKNLTVVIKKLRVVVAVSPKPTRRAKKSVTKSPLPKSPATKQSRSKNATPSPAPVVEKRSRKQPAASPANKKAVRVSLVLPKPSPVLKPQPAARAKRSKIEAEAESPKRASTRARHPAAGDAPAGPRGRRDLGTTKGKASPKRVTPQEAKATPEPKKGRRAPATPKDEEAGKAAKAPAPKGNTELPATPEPRRKGRKAPATPEAKKKHAKATPEPKKGRRAAPSPKPTPEPKKKPAKVVRPEPKKGRKTATKEQVDEPVPKRGRKTAVEVVKSPPAPRRAARAEAAPNQAAKSRGKKVTIVEPEQSPPRGRKRKNDSSGDKKKEPSPKKPRAGRPAAAAAAAARA